MKKFLLIGVGVMSAFAGFGSVRDCGWATVDCPDEWDPAASPKGFAVKVTIKPDVTIPEGTDVTAYMDWMREGGYGGFACWQPQKKAEPGKTYAFTMKTKVNEEAVRMDVRPFLAPKGDWNQRIKEAHCAVNLPKPPPYPEMPATATLKKSYIWLEEDPAPVRVGEEVVLNVHYYLDPSDTWGPKPTRLSVCPLGPWIDNPDGVINKTRHHVSYGGGMFTQEKKIEKPGEGVLEFRFKLGTAYRYNACFFLIKFKRPDGKDWPWDFRGGSLSVVPSNDYFRLVPTARGGCFYYDETPSIAVDWGSKCAGGLVTGRIVVKNCENRTVLEKSVKLNPARRTQVITLPELKERGVFSLTMTAPGKGEGGKDAEDFCYFARIPEFHRIEGRRTPFGVTDIHDLDLSGLAVDLGFSICRHFVSWNGLQPAKDRFLLTKLDATIKNNNEAGLKPWIMLYGPPAWTLPEGLHRTGQFEPAPFSLEAWKNALMTLAKRYQGKLYGFEFLNEIVPGNSCEDPVKSYVDICRTGYTALKKFDPNLVCQLAGGLWPHSFRIDCLNAGIAKYVDVLPVHYSTFEGVREAQKDLEVRGIRNVRVADNETATGMSVWNYPADMAFSSSLKQCAYVMKRWPDELCAGADFICYFGGGADACGNWSYMLDLVSPRPVVATLAVVQGKLAYAKPVGKFYLGETVCHLFESGGRALVFLSTPEKQGVKVTLPAKGALTVTDYQGNETVVRDGSVVTGDMPVIVEGADLDQLTLHTAFAVGAAAAPTAVPQYVTDFAPVMKLPVTVVNPYSATRTFTLTCPESGWLAAGKESVKLASGASATVEIPLAAKHGAKHAAANHLRCQIATDGLASVEKPFVFYVTDESSLGNLAKNGSFDADGKPWKGQGVIVKAPVPGDEANQALALSGKGKGYVHHTETTALPVPGGTYLYSCWARGEGMGGGSNLDEYDANGKHLKNYMMLRVFSIGGEGSKGWRYLSKKLTVGPDAAKLALTPVAEGKAGARIVYDNLQLSLYKGSDYVAFASADAKFSSPIPLLCENTVRAENGYRWTEKNLAGVGRFTWTKDALVFEAVVEDDRMDAKPVVGDSGEETLKGDSLAICLFPRLGPDGTPENDQLRWYLSRVSPGGGSGLTTVFRPKKYAMGAKSGQLCKDSSVYQVEMTRKGTTTTYRLRIPWSEIPGVSPSKGVSFGCNLVLTDTDGGREIGRIVWGGGLKEDSADCGLVTLIP